jgi:hypothetical protein
MVPDPSGTSSNGEGASSANSNTPAISLDDVMKGPSTKAPDVVVLDSAFDSKDGADDLDPKEDLWLSSADG